MTTAHKWTCCRCGAEQTEMIGPIAFDLYAENVELRRKIAELEARRTAALNATAEEPT